jgi:hypothetical protein
METETMDSNEQTTSHTIDEIIGLTRKLARERVKCNPFLRMLGNIDELSDIQLMGLPEATIITIIQTYYVLRTGGLSEDEALYAIESHRAIIGGGGGKKKFLGLKNFIEYRLTLEHSHGIGLESDYIEKVMIEATKIFA